MTTEFNIKRVIDLPSEGKNGDIYLLKKPNGRFSIHSVAPDGTLLPVQGLTDDELSKLNEGYSNYTIDSKLSQVESKLGQASGSVIPITGTVLPQGTNVPEYITTTGKAELQGGSGGKTYTQSGGSPITVGANNGRYAYYNKETNLWTPGEEYPLPQVTGVDDFSNPEAIPKIKAVERYVDSKTVPLNHGKNYFNPDTIIFDKLVSNIGSIENYVGWACVRIDISDIPDNGFIYISSDKNRAGLAFFDASVEGQDNPTGGRYIPTSLTGAFQKLLGEKYVYINLYSPTENTFTWMQVEAGSVATTFEEFKNIVPLESVEGLVESISASSEALSNSLENKDNLDNFEFVKEESINKLDPSKKVPDVLLNLSTGQFVTSEASINYNGFECKLNPSTYYKAVKSNNTTFIIRQMVFFDENGVLLSYFNTNTSTFTTPIGTAYARGAIQKTQGEDFSLLGIVESSQNFVSFSEYTEVQLRDNKPTLSKSNIAIATVQDVKNIAKTSALKSFIWSIDNNGNLNIDYGDGNTIKGDVANERGYTGNNMFNFKQSTIKGVTVGSGDDVAPMHIFNTTLGANHGASNYIATITAHGFDNNIIGQEFQKGSVKFYPLRIADANNIAFISENTGTDVDWLFTPLTTGEITKDGIVYNITAVSAQQLYPSIGLMKLDVFADGAKVDLGELGSSDLLEVVETYSVYNTSSVLNNTISRAGQPQDNIMSGDAAAIVKNTYSFTGNFSCVVSTSVTFKQSGIPFADIMGTQAVRIGGNPYYYLPNGNPVGTIDLRKPNQVVFNSATPAMWVYKNNLDPLNSPNRIIQYSGDAGFMIGYIPNYNDLSKTARMFNIRNNTGKIYPHPVESTSAVGSLTTLNQNHEIKMYRTYSDLTKTRKEGRMSYFIVHDNDDTYIFVDYSASMYDELLMDIPTKNGREIEVIESRNASLVSKTFNQGFSVNASYVEGETCFIVVKIR